MFGSRQELYESRIAEQDVVNDVCQNTTHGGCLGHVWDLTSMFVASKGMKYSLPCYHIQHPMQSMLSNPLFYYYAIKTQWEYHNTLHVDRFYDFVYFCSMPMDALDYSPHIVDFYIQQTQPTPSYYRFVVPVPKVIIPSESYPLPLDDMMSSVGSDSSSEDIETTSSVPMSPRSVLH